MTLDRRAQILEAARALLTEQGMGGLSVRGVAARAGIGASTLRHYFPTQRDLHRAVFQEALDAQVHDLRMHDGSVPPTDRLTECLLQFLPSAEGQARQVLPQWVAGLAATAESVAASTGAEGEADLGSVVRSTLQERGDERIRSWLAVLAEEGVVPQSDPTPAILLTAVIDGLTLRLATSPSSTFGVAQARALLADAVERIIASSC